jgi:hypothetical protein
MEDIRGKIACLDTGAGQCRQGRWHPAEIRSEAIQIPG